MRLFLKTLIIYVAAHSLVLAQTADDDSQSTESMYSERARLGNQRIQTEAEIKEREELRRLQEAERMQALEAARQRNEALRQSSTASTAAAESNVEISRTLEHLRSLGELRDDGYITAEEFQRLKQKIIDSQD